MTRNAQKPQVVPCDTTALKELLEIAARASKGKLPERSRALGELHRSGVNVLFSIWVEPETRKKEIGVGSAATGSSTGHKYMARIGEGGISLPTGKYYVTKEAQYTEHIRASCAMAASNMNADGATLAASNGAMLASSVDASVAFSVEKQVCGSQLRPDEAVNVANTTHIEKNIHRFKGLSWDDYFAGCGFTSTPREVNIESLHHVEECLKIFGSPEFQSYAVWRCVDSIASDMGDDMEKQAFEFYSVEVMEIKKDMSREKRRVNMIAELIPEHFGRLFVSLDKARTFSHFHFVLDCSDAVVHGRMDTQKRK